MTNMYADYDMHNSSTTAIQLGRALRSRQTTVGTECRLYSFFLSALKTDNIFTKNIHQTAGSYTIGYFLVLI